MPFNGSGTFSVVNIFIPNTTILSAAVNANFSDIATGLSDCLTRDGQAGMTAAFKAIAGSSGAPSITFTADATTGLYLPATGTLGLVAKGLGVKVNAEIFAVASAVVTVAGSGYVVGDTIYATGGSYITPFVCTVATLSGSGVATVTVTVPGIYTTKPSSPVAQGSTSGSGSGCTLTPTWNDPTSSDFKLGLTNLSDAALWTFLGSSAYVAGLMGKANALDFATGIGKTALTTVLGTTPPASGVFTKLTVKVASTTTVTVTADSVILGTGTGSYFQATSVSATCNLGTNGAVNTLDTGTIATNTWYYIFVIYNGTTTGTLASLSATAPTLPSGYTYFARVGAVQTINASATLYGTWQFGRKAQYVVALAQTAALPLIAQGTAGTYSTTSPTWATASTVRFVPTTASVIVITTPNDYKGGSNGSMQVAPNSSYKGYAETNGNAPPYDNRGGTANYIAAFPMVLESTNIYWTGTTTGSAVLCFGWEDNL